MEEACPLRCIVPVVPAADVAEGFGSASDLLCLSPVTFQMDDKDAGDKQLEGSDGEAPELDLHIEKTEFCLGVTFI